MTVTDSTIGDSVGNGIFNSSDGSTTITNSTVAGNTAVGVDDDGGTLNAVNCTIADNGGGLNIVARQHGQTVQHDRRNEHQ